MKQGNAAGFTLRGNSVVKAAAALFAGLAAFWSFGEGFSNSLVNVAFGDKGEIASIEDAVSGRELLNKPVPFAEVTLKDGNTKLVPEAFDVKDGRFVWVFSGGGRLELSAEPFEGGWTFKIERFTVKDAQKLEAFRIGALACDKWRGSRLKMLSDEDDGVILMAYDLKLGMGWCDRWSKALSVSAYDHFGFEGWRFGFAAGAKGRLREAMKKMTVATGMPYTTAGGAWALDSDLNRGSYVFSYTELAALDDWIDVCQRAGSMYLHMHIWYKNQGHYQVNERKFPGGIAGMKEAADRLHAAGLRPSMHTLTACISYDDPYVTPVPTDDLQVTYRYTLAKPLDKATTEIFVNEVPGELHAMESGYGTRGTFLKIGKEIVSYGGIVREKPYRFTNVKRGALGTCVADHAAGDRVDYLMSRYGCFFPEPNSPTAAAIAKRIAKVYSEAGIERVFLDGSEGICWSDYSDAGRYKIDRMLKMIFDSIDQSERPAKVDSSCGSIHGWWYHACSMPWDICIYGHKFFADDRAAGARVRDSDFMQPQVGWLGVTTGSAAFSGVTEDDIEYYGTRMVGVDAPTGIQRVDVNKKPLNAWVSHQLTLLGWYDRFRLARAFAPGVVEACAVKDSDYHLAQEASGEWRIAPAVRDVHRIAGPEDREWTFEMPVKPTGGKLRLEAFYGCSRYQDAADNVVFSAKDAGRLEISAAPKVKLDVKTGKDPRRGETLILLGENKSGTPEGSWAGAKMTIPYPHLDLAPAEGIGFWVKGDGSGATLDVQLDSGVNSDHLVTLDFEGWRYFSFLFRERDIARLRKEKWPFSTGWNTLKVALRPNAVKSVAFYLNSIPVPGAEANVFMDENMTRSSAEIAAGGTKVEISEVRALDCESFPLVNAKFQINGRKLKVPFDTLESGDVAELSGGVWTLRDERGELKECVPEANGFKFREGTNKIRFSATSFGSPARAEVRVIGYGSSRPALIDAKDWTPEQVKALSYEAMMPVEFAPTKGVESLPPIRVRPGEKAKLDVVVFGPVKNPAFTWNGGRAEFPVELKVGDRLFCRDGENWQVLDKDRNEVSKGALKTTLPILGGGPNDIDFDCDDRDDAEVRIDIVKRYVKQ